MSGPEGMLVSMAEIAEAAGHAIMAVLGAQLSVAYKEDKSPVTNADHAAHAVIEEGLKVLGPHFAFISEENLAHPERGERFWCVDPLDGTRSVLEGRGEFTVNIALVGPEGPEMGVLYCPLDGVCYAGEVGKGAWKKEERRRGGEEEIGKGSLRGGEKEEGEWRRIFVAAQHEGKRRAIVGARDARSIGRRMTELLAHMDAEAVMFMSSARKFGVLAEGLVDVYPRFMRTFEWDTAAGQAIVEAAGGRMTTMEGEPFRYGKEGFENGAFVVWGW